MEMKFGTISGAKENILFVEDDVYMVNVDVIKGWGPFSILMCSVFADNGELLDSRAAAIKEEYATITVGLEVPFGDEMTTREIRVEHEPYCGRNYIYFV